MATSFVSSMISGATHKGTTQHASRLAVIDFPALRVSRITGKPDVEDSFQFAVAQCRDSFRRDGRNGCVGMR